MRKRYFRRYYLDIKTRRLEKVLLDELVVEALTKAGWRSLDGNASGLQCGDLGVGAALATGDDGTGMTHTSARWGRDASDEGSDWLWLGAREVVLLEELCSILLGRAADLTNHDDTVSGLILQEHLEGIDKAGAREWIAANADDEGLAQADVGGLVDGFVGEGAGAGHDTDSAALVDVGWHDADLALFRSDDTRAVGADQSSLGLGLERVHHSHHVVLGNALGDTDDKGDLGFNGLHDGARSNCGRHKHSRRASARLLDALLEVGKHRKIEMGLTSLLRVGATNNLGPVIKSLLRVERALLASKTLEKNLGVGIDLQVLHSVGIALTSTTTRKGPKPMLVLLCVVFWG